MIWRRHTFVGGALNGQELTISSEHHVIRAAKRKSKRACLYDKHAQPELGSFEVDTYRLRRFCRSGHQVAGAVWYYDAYWSAFVVDDMSEKKALRAVADIRLPALYWDRTDEAKIALYGSVTPAPTGVYMQERGLRR